MTSGKIGHRHPFGPSIPIEHTLLAVCRERFKASKKARNPKRWYQQYFKLAFTASLSLSAICFLPYLVKSTEHQRIIRYSTVFDLALVGFAGMFVIAACLLLPALFLFFRNMGRQHEDFVRIGCRRINNDIDHVSALVGHPAPTLRLAKAAYERAYNLHRWFFLSSSAAAGALLYFAVTHTDLVKACAIVVFQRQWLTAIVVQIIEIVLGFGTIASLFALALTWQQTIHARIVALLDEALLQREEADERAAAE